MTRTCHWPALAVLILTSFGASLRAAERSDYVEAVRESHQRRSYLVTERAERSSRHWKRAWIAGWVAVGVTSALDVHSSRGKRELNPLLRASDGTFSVGKGVALKGALGGGFFLAQSMVLRKRPSRRMYKSFALANFGSAAGFGVVALHNYGVERR